MADRLSALLRQLRGGRTQVEAAAASGISQSAITRFESGRQVPRPDQVEALLDVYGATRGERTELVGLSNDLRARQRRIVVRRDHVAVQQEIRKAQETASLIRSFSPSGISGLLQTPGYIRAIFDDDEGGAVRFAGQKQLDDLNRQFVFLMPEGSLGWALRSTATMIEQVEYLSTESRRSNVRIGIIPWGRPSLTLPINSWEMYDDRAVWTGTNSGSTVLTSQHQVEPYRTLFVQLEELAVFGAAARAILAGVAARYRSL